MKTIEASGLATCSAEPDWREATVSVRRADWDAMSQEERAHILYGDTADDTICGMRMLNFAFLYIAAALVTVPIILVLWLALS